MTWTPDSLVAIESANSHNIRIAMREADDIAIATVHPVPFTRASGETGYKPDASTAALFVEAPGLLQVLTDFVAMVDSPQVTVSSHPAGAGQWMATLKAARVVIDKANNYN